jgi:hypothetical protein
MANSIYEYVLLTEEDARQKQLKELDKKKKKN